MIANTKSAPRFTADYDGEFKVIDNAEPAASTLRIVDRFMGTEGGRMDAVDLRDMMNQRDAQGLVAIPRKVVA